LDGLGIDGVASELSSVSVSGAPAGPEQEMSLGKRSEMSSGSRE